MKIVLQRISKFADFSIGILYVDGEIVCFTLEDQKQDKKVMHETRIPAGIYDIGFRTIGEMTKKYAKKFKNHRGMLHIKNIPNFENVYIHIGNDDDDTSGCILVGLNHEIAKNQILNSTIAYTILYKLICKAVDLGEKVTIQVVDELIY